MRKASVLLTALVAIEHVWFLILEMFLWTKPMGLETFKTTQEYANASATLAMNQGLYNGFLAAGLAWSLFAPYPKPALQLRIFFLGCVLVAGIFGGLVSSRTILVAQAAPALVTLVVVLLAARSSSASPS